MNIEDLEIGKIYRRVHVYHGQPSEKVRITKKEVNGEHIKVWYVTVREDGQFGLISYFNKIECERYLQ